MEGSLSLCFVHFHLSFVIIPILSNEEGPPAFSGSLPEATLIDGSVVVDESTSPVGESVLPLTFIVGDVVEQVVPTQLDTFPLGDMRDSSIKALLLSRTKIYFVFGST